MLGSGKIKLGSAAISRDQRNIAWGQEKPGDGRRGQKMPEEARRGQKRPGGAKRGKKRPGGAKKGRKKASPPEVGEF